MFTLGEGFVMTPVPDAEEKVSTGAFDDLPTSVRAQLKEQCRVHGQSWSCRFHYAYRILLLAASEKEEAELAALREKKQAVEEKMDHLKKVRRCCNCRPCTAHISRAKHATLPTAQHVRCIAERFCVRHGFLIATVKADC